MVPADRVSEVQMSLSDLEEGELPDTEPMAHQGELPGTSSLPSPEPQEAAAAAAKGRNKRRRGHSQAAAAAVTPTDVLSNVYGSEGRANVQLQHVKVPRLTDIQNLLLWILAEGSSPHWAFVRNKPLISKVFMVGIPGLDAALFQQAQMPNMQKYYGKPITVSTLNATVRQARSVQELFNVPFSRKRKQYMAELAGGMADAQPSKKPRKDAKGTEPPALETFPPAHYRMTAQQISERQFPACMRHEPGADSTGFVRTQPSGVAEDDPAWQRMVAMDCEMCVTEAGYELTRISLTDEAGQVLLDELVLPERPITDHNTQFSGITAAMLAPVQTRLADVQQKFLELVPAETLLVGHSLENDLCALKAIHNRLLDTCVLFPHPKGPPMRSKLSYLADRHLKRLIQAGSHDSVQDAQAAMDLVLLKIKNGPAYGMPQAREPTGDRLLQVLAAGGVRCSMVDRQDALNRHVTGNANALVCTSDAECVAKAAREIANPALGFVWTQLRDLNACHEAAVARQASVPYRPAKEAAAAMQPETDQKLQAPFPWPGYQPAPPAAPPAPSDAGQDGTAHPANGGQEHADSPGAAEEPASSAPVSPLEEQSPASKRRRKGDGAPAEPGTPPGGVHPATGIDRQLSVTDQAEARATPTRQPAQKAGKPRHTNPASALSEQAALAHVDTCMGRLFEAAVPNTLFIVPTCQGRTGLVRLMQERKWRSGQKLDGLPHWSTDCEAQLSKAAAQASRALCFVVVKQ